MSGVYGYPNDPTSTTGTVGTGGGAGGVVVDEGNTTVAALNNAQRGLAGDMGMYRNDTSGKQTTGGSANAYTVTLESVPTALADGLGFSAIIHASNTGATTINVNSLGAKKVLYKGVALSGGELVAGQPARFSYDASADSAAGAWLIENPVPVPATVSYSASEIANNSGVTGTNVDDALNTLDADKANLASPSLTGTPAAPTASAATNTTQIATTAFVTTAASAYTTFRNLIINGDMQVNQEGNKTGITGGHICDLITVNAAGVSAIFDLTQVADGPHGFANCAEVKVTTADASLAASDYTFLAWSFEGQNLQHVKKGTASAEPMILSFWSKTNKAGTYAVELYDFDNTRLFSAPFNLAGGGAWEQTVISIPADTTGAFDNDVNRSLHIGLWLAAGTTFAGGSPASSWETTVNNKRANSIDTNFVDTIDNYLRITGVQLEIGHTATEFEHIPYDVQLRRVRRYFERVQAEVAYDHILIGYAYSASQLFGIYDFSEEMRVTPTGSSGGNWSVLFGPSSITATSISFGSITKSSTRVDAILSSASAALGAGGILRSNNDLTAYLQWDARL